MSTTRNIIEGIKNVTSEGVTKAQVGLGSVDNTTDANKPVSTATQTALNGKAPIASPTFTGDLRADRLIAYGSGGRTSNVAVGAGSLNSNISEVQITAVGENALYNNTGGYNTAIGKDALYNNTTGIVNTGIGLNALKYKQDGSINTNFNYCTGLGFETRVGGNNATAIGCYASAPANCVALGTSSERTLVGGAVDNGVDRLQVNGSISSNGILSIKQSVNCRKQTKMLNISNLTPTTGFLVYINKDWNDANLSLKVTYSAYSSKHTYTVASAFVYHDILESITSANVLAYGVTPVAVGHLLTGNIMTLAVKIPTTVKAYGYIEVEATAGSDVILSQILSEDFIVITTY